FGNWLVELSSVVLAPTGPARRRNSPGRVRGISRRGPGRSAGGRSCPMPVTLAAIEDARRQIAGSALRTPLVRPGGFAAPAEIYVKLENLQPIGSFKVRGAANAMAHIPPDQLRRGVLTASAGNMAQGVAWRARELGIPCTVVAPETAPAVKLRAVERLG